MSDPGIALYQMGQVVSTEIDSKVTQASNNLLSSTNAWTGSNAFNNDVTIGDLAITDRVQGDVQLGDLTDFEAGLAS